MAFDAYGNWISDVEPAPAGTLANCCWSPQVYQGHGGPGNFVPLNPDLPAIWSDLDVQGVQYIWDVQLQQWI